MDGDGRLDLLTGSDNCCDREPGIFWVRRGADGLFTVMPKVRVNVVGGDRLFMPQFRATLVDWDGDGRQEVVAALTGTRPGLYRSAGSWSPNADVAAPRPVAGSPGLMHQPCIVDWDGDGRLDLVAARYRAQGAGRPSLSEVVWYRNIGEASEPRLAEPRPLLSFPESERAVGLSTDDWDRDGWPDLIVGYVRCDGDGRGSSWYAAAGIRVWPRRGSVSPGGQGSKPDP